jgi:hypothetical protein
MSTVCSISRRQTSLSSQTGRMSMAMTCHEASKSLWPSSRLDIPAFPLHGSSFKKGVRFSVQTTSCGRAPCSSCRFGSMDAGWMPSGSNEFTGLIVRVESMKFRDAQKRPESAFVSANHLVLALLRSAQLCRYIRAQLTPRPCLPLPTPTARRQSRPRAHRPTAARPSYPHPTCRR